MVRGKANVTQGSGGCLVKFLPKLREAVSKQDNIGQICNSFCAKLEHCRNVQGLHQGRVRGHFWRKCPLRVVVSLYSNSCNAIKQFLSSKAPCTPLILSACIAETSHLDFREVPVTQPHHSRYYICILRSTFSSCFENAYLGNFCSADFPYLPYTNSNASR